MKRTLTALLLVFVMLMGTVCSFAEMSDAAETTLTANQQAKMTLLYKMGIIESETVSDEAMTRGEFAYSLAKLSGVDTAAIPNKTVFSDVPETHKYVNAVAVVSALGCMNGISETEFGLLGEISRTNATVALIRLLGYENVAQQKGGYPQGYLLSAASLGLHKGADTDNERVNILLMCYNALLSVNIGANGIYDEESLLLENVHGVSKVKGIVTGNRFTCIGEKDSALEPDEIKIDDEIYFTEDVSFAELIGEYVEGYYYYDKANDEKHIVSLTVNEEKFEKLVIEDEDIVSAKNNTIVYVDENDDEEKIKLRPGFDYILNNCTVDERTTQDLKVADGNLTLIDYDGDEVYDLAMVKSIETMVYQGADNLEDLIYCKEGTIYTNPFDEAYYCEIILINEEDRTEKSVSIDEIPTGAVLTVYRSNDEKYLKIYAIQSNIYGYIEEISDEEIIIDGALYELPIKTPREDLVVGAKVAFSRDMFGRLVYLDESENKNGPHYGYFFAYDAPKGLGKGKVKIIIGDETLILPLAEEVKIDDAGTVSGSEFNTHPALFDGGVAKRQLIRYALNADGEVKALYTASGSSQYSIRKQPGIEKTTNIKYYQWHNIWAEQYILPDENFFLVIPDYVDTTTGAVEADNEELYSSTYKWGSDINYLYYTDTRYLAGAEIYDVDDNMEAGAILIYVNKPLDGQAETDTDTASGIFMKATMGAEGPKAYIYTSSGEAKVFDVKPEYYPTVKSITDILAFGDVVRYVTTADGAISTFHRVLDVGTSGETTDVVRVATKSSTDSSPIESSGYYNYYFARVYKKLDNHLAIIPNLLTIGGVTSENRTFDPASNKRVVLPTQIQTCRLIDMKSQRIVSGSLDAIVPHFGEDLGGCYVYAKVYKFSSVIELFIYKF